MKIYRSLAALIITFIGTLSILAQDVTVTVTPVQQVLPPQVMLYLSDPGKFFTISLINSSSETKYVHLGLQLEQTTPSSGLAISTPANRQPQVPFTIPANSVYNLTTVDMKKLFDHIPASEISCPEDLFTNYENGSFGLLPEGFYQVHLTAYKWSENNLSTPVVESSPTGGIATFQVCYNAQAPQILTPMLLGTEDPEVAEIDPLAAQFTWTEPLIACSPGFMKFKYSLRIVELLPNQEPDYALDNNPTVYFAENLTAPTCMIPVTTITRNFFGGKTYLAQVTATASNANSTVNYVLIENEGKSSFRKFCIKVKKDEPKPEPEPEPEPDPVDDPIGGGGKDDDGYKVYWGDKVRTDSTLTDSLYTFRNPVITSPTFEELAARKILAGHDLNITWDRALHIGGEGMQPDTLKFEYKLKLHNGGTNADKEAALASAPIYEKIFKSSDEMSDSISWDSLSKIITPGDYIVLHIEPQCTNSEQIGYTGDKHIVDFAYVEQLSQKYFECSSQVEITNKEPLKASADELKGKTIAIGEYQMTIDEISDAGDNKWKGKGRVEWNPMGTTVMVCVEFSDLEINTDYTVYGGNAKTYSNNEASDAEVVDKLFSDWGIDNLIADTGIPYADYLQSSATDGVKDIAKKLDLSKYYQYVKSGQAISSLLGISDIDALYFPVALPDSTNKSPVDLQIAGMTFSAEFATMNIIGEFTLPNSDYTKNDILVFGAPRLCISPDNIIPEGGTVALLSHFTIVDPKSDFEFTFKAPENVISPTNGCYLAWKDYTFEQLGIDIEMKIPGLKKEVNGELTDSMPSIYAQTRISEWENWLIDRVSMDPFQAEELPGWTFTVSDIVYDHSVRMNSNFMGKFPEGYDKEQSLTLGDVNSWQGLYIKEVSVAMPEALEFGDSTGNKRLKISAEDMFFDKSGATLRIGADNVLSAKTGKAGGWAFSLNSVSLEFIQNNFNYCKFDGAFDVPLIEGEIGYECQIMYLGKEHKSKAGNYAYVFRTQQVDSLNFDFMLARADMDKNLTYFLVEAEPEKDEMVTKVELLLGGTLTIGGTDYLQEKIDNIGMDFSIPGIHFAKMRIANCKQWESKYDFVKEMQTAEDNADILFSFYENKDHEVSENFWFSTGEWSLASLPDKDEANDDAYIPNDGDTYYAHGPSEYGPRGPDDEDDNDGVASQTLGPFTFTLKDYNFDFKDSQLAVGLEGEVRFLKEIEFGASAGITIKAELLGVTEAMSMDFSKLNFKYKDTEFDKASFDASFAGMTIKGSLIVSNDETNGKGYGGSLKFTMPGELFTVDALGGYFERSDFTWGYFQIELGSSTGLRLDPVVINNIKGGFYFNCIRKSESEPEPQKGIIGVVAGIGLSTSIGEDALKGEMEMTVIYDRENDRLSTFVFTGTIKAVGGLVNSKASIVYECTDLDEYFSLNVTIDAKLDPMQSDMAKALKTEMDGITSKLQELNSECEGLVADVKGSLTDLAGDSDEKASEGKREGSGVDVAAKSQEAQNKAEAEAGMTIGGIEISLDLRITMKENGKDLDKVKWRLCIGEPEEDKRCKFTLIDFKSPIVSVNIGANAYLCLGNELPGDGELPPIPDKVQQFLDGSTQGKGVKSDDMNKANRGRTKALENFKADVSGGLMLGASVWGYVDVDLGLFYGEMGAIGGFDLSLRKLSGMACINLPGTEPGYHGWYGEGQLYAYLYAIFGLKLDLGFWEGKFEVLNAGIGGVMRMGGINPNYFTGAARVKLTAFGGMLKLNRKFEFECGDVCDVFLGNALDDFELFVGCSLGDTLMENGWSDENKISRYDIGQISVETTSPLDQHFRVLDPTELARIERNMDAGKEELEALASRTFTFKIPQYRAELYEYDIPYEKPNTEPRLIYFDEDITTGTKHFLQGLNPQPNKYYKLVITGCAKEIYEGEEGDPLKYNLSKNVYERVPWNQSVTYYFCTNDKNMESINSVLDIQKHVAFAFPSDYGQLKSLEGVIDTAYIDDIKSPIIALKTYITENNETFKYRDNHFVWQLCNVNGDTIETRKNKFYSSATDYTSYMKPETPFTKVEAGKKYKLRLVYYNIEYVEDDPNATTIRQVAPADTTARQIATTSNSGVIMTKTGTSTGTGTGITRLETTPSLLETEDLGLDSLVVYTVTMEMEDATLLANNDACGDDVFITKLDYLDDQEEENGYVGRMSMAPSEGEYCVPAEQIIRKTNITTTTTKTTTTTSKTTTTGTTSTTQAADTTTSKSLNLNLSKTQSGTTTTSNSELNMVLSDTVVSTPSSGTLTSNVTNEASGIIKKALTDESNSSGATQIVGVNNNSSSGMTQQEEADLIQGALESGIAAMNEARAQEEMEQRVGELSLGGTPSNNSSSKDVSGTMTICDTLIVDLNLHAVEGNWRVGYKVGSKRYHVAYEIPFLGVRMREINFNNTEDLSSTSAVTYTDKLMAQKDGIKIGSKLARLRDPYWYLSYLTNYAYVGGYRLAEKENDMGIMATTTEALNINTPYGTYSGFCEDAYGIIKGVDQIRKFTYYISPNNYYPLPYMEYDLHTYREGGDDRSYIFNASANYADNIKRDLDYFKSIRTLTTQFNKEQYTTMGNALRGLGTGKVDSVRTWHESRIGTYLTVSSDDGMFSLQLPIYHGPLIWGSQFDNNFGYSGNHLTMWDMLLGWGDDAVRPTEDMSEDIMESLWGTGQSGSDYEKVSFSDDFIKDATFEIYRVNSYNINTRQYLYLLNTEKEYPQTLDRIKVTKPASDSPKVEKIN